MNTLGGLPAHPLMVHIPVALVPLVLLGVVAMALRGDWFERLWVAVSVVVGISLVGTFLASGSGEALEESIESSGQNMSAALRDHVEMGESAQGAVASLAVFFAVWVTLAWWRRRVGDEKAVAVLRRPALAHTVLSGIVVLAAIIATIVVYRVGHSGATSVWDSAGG